MDAPSNPIPSDRADVAAVLAEAKRASQTRRRWAWALWIAAALVAVLGAAGWWASRSAPAIAYTTEPVTRGDLTVTVTATGSLHPTNEVEISSELSGTIREVLVDYNSRVRKGDHLAQLDTDNLEMSVQGAKAKLAVANAGVAQARATITELKSELERRSALVKRGVATGQSLEVAEAAYDRAVAGLANAEAAVAVAKADLALAETNLGKACICSPIDGVVLSRSVEPGQTVAASLQAPVLFTIAEDLTKMELRVDIDEADVGRVAEGQAAEFTVDAYPGRSFPATIRTIRFASETVQGVVTYKGILDVANDDLSLRPGMTATADIIIDHVQDALLVPNQALRWAPDTGEAASGGNLITMLLPRPPAQKESAPEATGGGPRIYVLRNGEPEAVDVTLGATDGQHTAVTGGIAEGDRVVVDSTRIE